MEEVADLDAAAGEELTRRLDVGDNHLQALDGARLRLDDALAKRDRAPGVGRRELDRPDALTELEIGVQPPSEALVEALRTIDVGNRDRDDLELHVDRPGLLGGGRRFGAHVSGAHADLRRLIAGVKRPARVTFVAPVRSLVRSLVTRGVTSEPTGATRPVAYARLSAYLVDGGRHGQARLRRDHHWRRLAG
jgi:hypothetical protein